jgi:hypothetical protein
MELKTMAYDLSKLSKPDGNRPVICTIFGEAGMGKTTLAAMFPKPVFIRTEDGTQSLVGNDNVALFPVARSSDEVLDQIESLATEDHDFQTLVVDSITQLATLIEGEIVDADPKAKSINQAGGGYGAGYNAAADKHRTVRDWAGALAYDRGMNVVFIGHADTETLDLPDADPYARYTVTPTTWILSASSGWKHLCAVTATAKSVRSARVSVKSSASRRPLMSARTASTSRNHCHSALRLGFRLPNL